MQTTYQAASLSTHTTITAPNLMTTQASTQLPTNQTANLALTNLTSTSTKMPLLSSMIRMHHLNEREGRKPLQLQLSRSSARLWRFMICRRYEKIWTILSKARSTRFVWGHALCFGGPSWRYYLLTQILTLGRSQSRQVERSSWDSLPSILEQMMMKFMETSKRRMTLKPNSLMIHKQKLKKIKT